MKRTPKEVSLDNYIAGLAKAQKVILAIVSFCSAVFTAVSSLGISSEAEDGLKIASVVFTFAGGVLALILEYYEGDIRERAKTVAEARKRWYYMPKSIVQDLRSSKGREKIYSALSNLSKLSLTFVSGLLNLYTLQDSVSPQLASFFNFLLGSISGLLKEAADQEKTKSATLADSNNRIPLTKDTTVRPEILTQLRLIGPKRFRLPQDHDQLSVIQKLFAAPANAQDEEVSKAFQEKENSDWEKWLLSSTTGTQDLNQTLVDVNQTLIAVNDTLKGATKSD